MNERIKELAREAGLLVHNPEGVPTKLEKFAELIVAECVKLQYKNVVVGGVSDYNRGRRELTEDIQKHFGVEE